MKNTTEKQYPEPGDNVDCALCGVPVPYWTSSNADPLEEGQCCYLCDQYVSKARTSSPSDWNQMRELLYDYPNTDLQYGLTQIKEFAKELATSYRMVDCNADGTFEPGEYIPEDTDLQKYYDCFIKKLRCTPSVPEQFIEELIDKYFCHMRLTKDEIDQAVADAIA